MVFIEDEIGCPFFLFFCHYVLFFVFLRNQPFHKRGKGGGHTGLWNMGMWHFNPNRSFQSQMDPKLFNLIPKVIIVAPKTFQRFIFCIWEIFFEKFERFSLKCSNFVNFWARKTFFFFKQVRISPEIDWYHYQSANAAPMAIVRHRHIWLPYPSFWTLPPLPKKIKGGRYKVC